MEAEKIKWTKFSLLSRVLLIKSTRKKRAQGKISDERAKCKTNGHFKIKNSNLDFIKI